MSTVNTTQAITIALSCADRKRSVGWYQQHLGFETMFESDEMGWSEVRTNTPGVTLGFGDAQSPQPGNSVPVFGVDDIEVAVTAMRAAGIKIDGDILEYPGMVKLITFYDPDDNALMLAQDMSG